MQDARCSSSFFTVTSTWYRINIIVFFATASGKVYLPSLEPVNSTNQRLGGSNSRLSTAVCDMFALRRTTLTAARLYAARPFGVSVSAPPVVRAASPRTTAMSTLTLDAPIPHSSLTSSSWLSSIDAWLQDGLYWISTLKRRRKMMNKHKLRKRRKKNRMKNK